MEFLAKHKKNHSSCGSRYFSGGRFLFLVQGSSQRNGTARLVRQRGYPPGVRRF